MTKSLRAHRRPLPLGWRLVGVALVALAAGCGDDGTTPGPDGSGSGSGGFGVGSDCETDDECLAIMQDQFNYDEVCTDISCVQGSCVFEGDALDDDDCDDGNACTTDDACSNRRCRGTLTECDDEEACTADECDLESGDCEFTLTQGLPCDDGVGCTETDRCDVEGGCAGVPTASCQCLEDTHCSGLSSQNKCEGFFRCEADYSCVFDPTTVVDCDGHTTACAVGVCDPDSGVCGADATNDGGDCDTSDNPCVQSGSCNEGVCEGPAVECDDGDPCTEDSCSPAAGGCIFEPLDGGPCDDGSPCTQGDECDEEGTCSGVPLTCEDANLCTVGACDEETGDCLFDPVDGPCVHNDPCIEEETCVAGECAGQLVDCDDGDVCTDDACKINIETSTASCHHDAHPDLEPCDDGEPCTEADFCQSGACTAGAQLCQCQLDEDCAVFDDGDPCTPAFVCNTDVMPTVCEEDPTSVPTCDPVDIPCLVNVCQADSGECGVQDEADGVSCDDGDACSTDGFCFEGSCASTPIDCEDGDECTGDPCFAGECSHTGLSGTELFVFADFDDGLPGTWSSATTNPELQWSLSSSFDSDGAGAGMVVTGAGLAYVGPGSAELRSPWFSVYGESVELHYKSRIEVAESGCGADLLEVAVEAYGIDTPVQLLCQTDYDWTEQVVDLTDWKNQHIRLVFTFRANANANDGFGAAVDDVQVVGTFTCLDDDACTTSELCLAGQCFPEETDCDDSDGCTADSCDATLGCTHAPLETCTCNDATECADPGPCSEVDCFDGVCVETAVSGACTDGSVCSVGDHCELGACVGDEIACDDGDPCTVDGCDPTTGCTIEPIDGPCDDGDPCTIDDSCASGTCKGEPLDCQGGGDCTTASCVGGDCTVLPLHDGQLGFNDDFDAGAIGALPSGWLLDTSDDAFGWISVAGGASSEPNALALVGPPDGAWESLHVAAITSAFAVPPAGGELSFMANIQLADDSCASDLFTVSLGDDVIWSRCADTAGWMLVTLPVEASEELRILTFALDVGAGVAGSFDARIDSVAVTEFHPCALTEPCLDGLCVVGSCVTEVVPGCE